MIGGSLPVDARQADAERLGEGRDSKGLWRSSRAPWPSLSRRVGPYRRLPPSPTGTEAIEG